MKTLLRPDPPHAAGGPPPALRAEVAAGRLDACDPAGAAEVQLLDRVDTKYLLPADDVPGLLDDLAATHEVLVVGERRVQRYANQYLDTPDLWCFRSHHDRVRPRFKFRFRRYETTGTTFFEVKHKPNTGRTIKRRIEVDEATPQLTGDALELANEIVASTSASLDATGLEPSVRVDFARIGLLARDRHERATIDVDLRVDGPLGTARFERLAICELKQPAASRRSAFTDALDRRAARPRGISKYCLGVVATRDGVKTNRFKQLVRSVDGVGR